MANRHRRDAADQESQKGERKHTLARLSLSLGSRGPRRGDQKELDDAFCRQPIVKPQLAPFDASSIGRDNAPAFQLFNERHLGLAQEDLAVAGERQRAGLCEPAHRRKHFSASGRTRQRLSKGRG
jgi:hypothetical protein